MTVTAAALVGREVELEAGSSPDQACGFADAEAGFASVEVLPVENDFFRLYRLHA